MEQQVANRKQVLRRGGFILLAVAVIVILATVVLGQLGGAHLTRMVRYHRPGSPYAAEIRFTSLSDNTFASLDNGIAVASGSGLGFYDRTGSVVYTSLRPLRQPMIDTAGNYVVAYDLGGTDILVGNRREVLHRIEAEGRIIDTRVNENGWVTVSVEQAGTLGAVRVYDPNGTPRFRVHISTGHLVGAALAADNRTLALLTMTEDGGRVLWYAADTPADEPRYTYLREDELFFDLWFTSPSGAVGVISNNAVIYLNAQGEFKSEYLFPNRRLQNFDVDEGNVALYLSHHQTGAGGELVVLEPTGERERVDVMGYVFDISLAGRYMAAIYLDTITVYRRGRAYADFTETEGMTNVLMRDDGTLFRLAPHWARLLIP
ncbi:MAG: DUF5711 family protein [Oscillospiraceae bacterium]|nr:DUF5711 family protein [Oscillospiraceae bacterium]